MSVQQRVDVYMRHKMHTLRDLEYLTSQEINQALGGAGNATPINVALLKLRAAGKMTRRVRHPSNTFEWRSTPLTKAPTAAELQCLPPELLVKLEKAEAALATPAAVERRPIPTAAEVQRVGLPTVVVPAPVFDPTPDRKDVEQSHGLEPEPESEATTSDLYERTKRTWIKGADNREAQAAEFRADVTAAALEPPGAADLQEAGGTLRRREGRPDDEQADLQPITLSDVLARYRARQYDRLQIDDAAIIEIARVILARQQVPAVFVSLPNDHGPYGAGIYAAVSEFPLQVRDFFAPPTEGWVDTIPRTAAETLSNALLESAMDSALSQLAQPQRSRVSVPDQVLWALAKLGPALPPPIAALLAEAHAILSKPLLTESEPAA